MPTTTWNAQLQHGIPMTMAHAQQQCPMPNNDSYNGRGMPNKDMENLLTT